jgi:hypothetical protein
MSNFLFKNPILGDSPWDKCLAELARDSGLSAAEEEYFYLRFAERYRKIFQNRTILEALEEISKGQDLKQRDSEDLIGTLSTNYKKQMGQIYSKCGKQLNIKYETRYKKDQKLLQAITNYINIYKPKLEPMGLHERFANVIQDLDYSAQESEFTNDLPASFSTAKAFFLQVSFDNEECLLQKILIRRLCRFLTCAEIPEFHDLKIRLDWQENSIEKICDEFARKYNLKSNNLNGIISFIVKQTKTQPVIIALRNVPAMGSQISVLLNDFWYPLVGNLKHDSCPETDVRLLLFLSGIQDISKHFNDNRIGCPKALSPLEQITRQDVREWRRSSDVCGLIRACKKSKPDLESALDFISNFQEQKDPQVPLGDSAYEAIGMVSEAFGFSKDLYQFMQYWELTGDLMT